MKASVFARVFCIEITTSSTRRSAPDFSFDADPHSGVSVYDSTQCQGLSRWLVFGGTSVSSPSLAGIVNLAGHFYSSSTSELTTMYTNRANSSDFRDIRSGSAGSFSANWQSAPSSQVREVRLPLLFLPAFVRPCRLPILRRFCKSIAGLGQ